MPKMRENKLPFAGDNQLHGLTSAVFQKNAALGTDPSHAVTVLTCEILTEIPVQPDLIYSFSVVVMSILVLRVIGQC